MSTSTLSASLLSALVLTAVVITAACSECGSPRSYDRVDRHSFNRAAVRLDLPLFWVADGNNNSEVEPGEVVSLLFYPTQENWVDNAMFTAAFAEAYELIVTEAGRSEIITEGLTDAEVERRSLVRQDLDYGIATLVHNDLRSLPEEHRVFARHMLRAADLIDVLFARQTGAADLADQVPDGDSASQAMFRRNWGPQGAAPATETNPACSAIPGAPKPVVDAYRQGLPKTELCTALENHPRSTELVDPFTVVREVDGELVGVALSTAYAAEMGAIAEELRAAVEALSDPKEDALRAYLLAAAQSFSDNVWPPADEAWASMNARNSRWYLRIAPDEVYWSPCAQKAGFHLTLALINRDSLAWQDRLTPVRQEMEDQLGELIGTPYAVREVGFQLPDFIDIVINAGNDRTPFGATIGQSLPNWGPVANEGRGRTVAMSNFYTDSDSLTIRRAQAESLLDKATMDAYSSGPESGLLGTILHEAAHNLGPSHEYQVEGKTDTEIFGGGLASTMEELKAQCGAVYYIEFLRSRGLIPDELARQSYVDSLIWAFGHISRGMYTATGARKAYSQLAVIQVGLLLAEGGLSFDPDGLAANGTDHGVWTIDFAEMPGAATRIMQQVGRIKASGDRAQAEELCKTMVDGDAVPQALISERILRHPKASFIYGLDL